MRKWPFGVRLALAVGGGGGVASLVTLVAVGFSDTLHGVLRWAALLWVVLSGSVTLATFWTVLFPDDVPAKDDSV